MSTSTLQPGASAPHQRAPFGIADARLRSKTIVLVGLMGSGKTTVGRGLATALSLPFRDADEEIERAAACTVADLFAERGEAEFREGERRVIARLITQEPPHVLAFGGGAFLRRETRDLVSLHARSIWLKTDIAVLARRVARKTTRPLLQGKDPLVVLRAQAGVRYPTYAEAMMTVDAAEISSAATVAAVLTALSSYVAAEALQAPDDQAL